MLVRLFILTLLPGIVWAKEFKVNFGLYCYELNMTREALSLSGAKLELNLSKDECSKKLITPVEKDIEESLKRMRIIKNEDPKAVKVTSENKVSYFSRKVRKEDIF